LVRCWPGGRSRGACDSALPPGGVAFQVLAQPPSPAASTTAPTARVCMAPQESSTVHRSRALACISGRASASVVMSPRARQELAPERRPGQPAQNGETEMTHGDGIRRNAAKITDGQRARLRDAFIALDTDPRFVYPDGVTYWDKQEDIHKNAHAAGQDVHTGPAFLPWHRVLIGRLEALLRAADPS